MPKPVSGAPRLRLPLPPLAAGASADESVRGAAAVGAAARSARTRRVGRGASPAAEVVEGGRREPLLLRVALALCANVKRAANL
eukprot:3727044-Pleurochrysis_carterae.AAC.1